MSLSTWFRDYLYIPLGGSRKGEARTIVNLLIVWLATGLWHGASWTFVLWGLWHGLFSVLEDSGALPAKRLQGRLPGRVYTLLVVVLGFTLFRAGSLSQAGAMFAAMFTGVGLGWTGTATVCSLLTPAFLLTLFLALLLCVPIAKRLPVKNESITLAGSLALLALCMLNLSAGTFNPFIYFQF